MRGMKMVRMMALLLITGLLAATFSVDATPQRSNPEAGKKKAAKRIGIGAAIGGAAGGLIGGRKGALIGAGVGAGGGTVYHVRKKRKAARRRRH